MGGHKRTLQTSTILMLWWEQKKKEVENLGCPAITETTEKGDSVMYRKCMDILGNDGFCQMHRVGSGKSTGEMNKDG